MEKEKVDGQPGKGLGIRVTGDWSCGDIQIRRWSRADWAVGRQQREGPGAEYSNKKGTVPPKPKPSRLQRLMKLRPSGSALGRERPLSVLPLFSFVSTALG